MICERCDDRRAVTGGLCSMCWAAEEWEDAQSQPPTL